MLSISHTIATVNYVVNQSYYCNCQLCNDEKPLMLFPHAGYVSTLSLNDGQVFNLPPDMETLMINFDEAIPIGFDEYSEAFVRYVLC